MPTITANIANNADDGYAFFSTVSPIGTSFIRTGSWLAVTGGGWTTKTYKKTAWTRFTGITINNAVTITSASIKLHVNNRAINMQGKVHIDNRQTPDNPTTPQQVIYPTINTGGNITFTLITVIGTYADKSSYLLQEINVTNLVQNLVNQYTYNNGEMVFYYSGVGYNQWYIYPREWSVTTPLVWDGGGGAKLVIEYSLAATLKDKTTYVFK